MPPVMAWVSDVSETAGCVENNRVKSSAMLISFMRGNAPGLHVPGGYSEVISAVFMQLASASQALFPIERRVGNNQEIRVDQ